MYGAPTNSDDCGLDEVRELPPTGAPTLRPKVEMSALSAVSGTIPDVNGPPENTYQSFYANGEGGSNGAM